LVDWLYSSWKPIHAKANCNQREMIEKPYSSNVYSTSYHQLNLCTGITSAKNVYLTNNILFVVKMPIYFVPSDCAIHCHYLSMLVNRCIKVKLVFRGYIVTVDNTHANISSKQRLRGHYHLNIYLYITNLN
jgi:hypothetical protein